MYLPRVKEQKVSKATQIGFQGYNHNLYLSDTQFYNMQNMTSAYYPVLSPREKRGVYPGAAVSGHTGEPVPFRALLGLCANEKLAWAEGPFLGDAAPEQAQFYYNGVAVTERIYTDGENYTEVPLTLSPGPKQFVTMGAYILIFPDKLYFHTRDWSFGSLEAFYSSKAEGNESVYEAQITPVTADGELYTDYLTGSAPDTAGLKKGQLWLEETEENGVKSETLKRWTGTGWRVVTSAYKLYAKGASRPKSPNNGDYWLDTSARPNTLHQYAAASEMWVPVTTSQVKITCEKIGVPFAEGDGVTLQNSGDGGLDGTHLIAARGQDYIIIDGVLGEAYVQEQAILVSREVPDMDFVAELGNRVWGCSSEKHQIYACKLGDPKNWNCFAGLSTDSFALTVGSEGDFTGAAAHLGYVLFFKENLIHKIYGTKPANFQLLDTNARGVEKGSEGSLAAVNEVLYYKSRDGVCAYDGSLPYTISADLGTEHFQNASAGALGSRYYLSMQDEAAAWHLFVYDTSLRQWHREDALHATYFTRWGDTLYYIDRTEETAEIRYVQVEETIQTPEGTQTILVEKPYTLPAGARVGAVVPPKGALPAGLVAEEAPAVSWFVETGELLQKETERKYIAKLQLRMQTQAPQAEVRLSISYNYGAWETVFAATAEKPRTLLIPVIPRRSDSVRLRVAGSGPCKVFAITKQVELGSEV